MCIECIIELILTFDLYDSRIQTIETSVSVLSGRNRKAIDDVALAISKMMMLLIKKRLKHQFVIA